MTDTHETSWNSIMIMFALGYVIGAGSVLLLWGLVRAAARD